MGICAYAHKKTYKYEQMNKGSSPNFTSSSK